MDQKIPKKEYLIKIRNRSEDITKDLTEIRRIISEYYEQLHTN